MNRRIKKGKARLRTRDPYRKTPRPNAHPQIPRYINDSTDPSSPAKMAISDRAIGIKPQPLQENPPNLNPSGTLSAFGALRSLEALGTYGS
jgi:hypothetical protein